jgi:hypothetical protein
VVPELVVPVVPVELLDVLLVPAVEVPLVPEVPPVEVPEVDEVPDVEADVLVSGGGPPELQATPQASADAAIHPVTPRMATSRTNLACAGQKRLPHAALLAKTMARTG